ncbi:MAG: F0F1 ATP synthase subunit A, partial [candidate division Zixibacteria bacterium]|nr:F0F1 ATP synthase subunit A [candidate division Zixibacteria bacterium]
VFSLIIATVLWLVFHIGSRKRALVPAGLQNFLEIIVDGLRRFVVGILGPEGERFVPFLGTLFLYIFLMNLFGLIPAMKSPSSSINITAGLALAVFSLVLYLNIRNMGMGGFLYHLAGSPKGLLGWSLVPLMFPIELLTYLARPMTLALRLFGNIMGEDILIAAFAFMGIALVGVLKSPVGLPLQVPFMFLAMLTSLLQALVFTLLSAVYIALAVPHKAEH